MRHKTLFHISRRLKLVLLQTITSYGDGSFAVRNITLLLIHRSWFRRLEWFSS